MSDWGRRSSRWSPAALARYFRWVARGRPDFAPLPRSTVAEWRNVYDTVPVEAMDADLLVTIVLPSCCSDSEALARAINSVVNQQYETWQLVVVDPPGTDRTVTGDERIQILEVGAATVWDRTSAGAGQANGEYIVFLGQHDELEERALPRVVACTQGCDVVYSDEVTTHAGDGADEAIFKPAWSPRLLLSLPYLGDLLCIRVAVLVSVGGLDPSFGAGMRHDLLLRLAELDPHVVHIPDLLYRAGRGACVGNLPDVRALEAAVARRGWRAHATSIGIEWDVRNPPEQVKVVIPTRDRADLLARVVDGVLNRTLGVRVHLVIVDNGSVEPKTQQLLAELSERDAVTVMRIDEPFNFSRLCNQGAAAGPSCGHVVFLNNDVHIVDDRWLVQLVGWFGDQSVVAAGPLLRFPDGRIQHAGVAIAKQDPGISDGPGVHRAIAGHVAHSLAPEVLGGSLYGAAREVTALTGACLVVDTEAFWSVGGFDEGLAVDFQDVDICLRLGSLSGRVLVYDPRFCLEHEESASRGFEGASSPATLELLERRWGNVVDAGDRYFSPHLGLDLEMAPMSRHDAAAVRRAVTAR